ncbi:hypothetical protein DRQ33_06815, partial [bacterium]
MRKLTLFLTPFILLNILFAFGLILPEYEKKKVIRIDELDVIPYEAELKIKIMDNFVIAELTQTFLNKKNRNAEGIFKFPLPEGMDIIGFATWDGSQRIPGVILEKRKAIQIYEELRARAIDPGILLPTSRNIFTAKITPIFPYSTKLLELQFAGLLPEIDNGVKFLLPLSPSEISSFPLRKLKVSLIVLGKDKIDDISVSGIPVKLQKSDGKYTGDVQLENIELHKSLMIEYTYAQDINPVSVSIAQENDDVYGLALFSPPIVEYKQKISAIILADISASVKSNFSQVMTSAIETAELANEFDILCFNDSIYEYSGNQFVSQTSGLKQFFSDITPAFGTNLLSALNSGYKRLENTDGRKVLVLITDGVPTVGEIGKNMITGLVKSHSDIPIYVIAMGTRIADQLLLELTEYSDGAILFIPSGATDTEVADEIERVIKPYIQRKPTTVNKIECDDGKILDIYPKKLRVFGGIQGALSFRMNKLPSSDATLWIYTDDGGKYSAPVGEPGNIEHISRLWATGRVDFLLRKIAQQGEKDEWINEIIALSKKYTFVTPYTAFLAAPRAVLRPRVIQPADPKLVIDAPTAVRVVVELPWGEQIIAQKNEHTKMWEARFLVPQDVTDGEYRCVLTITDKSGAQWQQNQTFVVDTKPPEITAEVKPDKAYPGEEIILKVFAPQDTRTIMAKTPDGKTLKLRYNHSYSASIAHWIVSDLPAGKYT